MSQTIYIAREYQIGYNESGDTILATFDKSVVLAEVAERYGEINEFEDYNKNKVYKSGEDLCDPFIVVEEIKIS